MAACCVDEAWREGVYPVVDGARVDGDASLGQPLGEIGMTEPEPQVPADGQPDHLIRELVKFWPAHRWHCMPISCLLVERPA